MNAQIPCPIPQKLRPPVTILTVDVMANLISQSFPTSIFVWCGFLFLLPFLLSRASKYQHSSRRHDSSGLQQILASEINTLSSMNFLMAEWCRTIHVNLTSNRAFIQWLKRIVQSRSATILGIKPATETFSSSTSTYPSTTPLQSNYSSDTSHKIK